MFNMNTAMPQDLTGRVIVVPLMPQDPYRVPANWEQAAVYARHAEDITMECSGPCRGEARLPAMMVPFYLQHLAAYRQGRYEEPPRGVCLPCLDSVTDEYMAEGDSMQIAVGDFPGCPFCGQPFRPGDGHGH